VRDGRASCWAHSARIGHGESLCPAVAGAESAADRQSCEMQETQNIEAALSALEHEKKTLEELSQQAKLEHVSFVATWRTAGIQGKLELQKALFPSGLVWSHETGFFKP
jgi:hypothetical protein